MSSKLVCNVGFNSGKYPATKDGKILKEYDVWRQVLVRCYDPKYQKKKPSYIGCSVSENFKNFTYFYEWARQQIGFGQENYHLDKDLLIKGNKLYSEDTCLFLPQELNSLLLSNKAVRGSLPIGVCAHNGKFLAQCLRKPASHHVGVFDTPELAFLAYKEAKETYIKLQAEKWKALIDPRAFAALMAYEVLPTD